MTKSGKYTLVQHSGVGTGHAEFAQAVESVCVGTQATEQRVVKAGGLLFASYGEAEAAAERENYQPGNNGLMPRAPGTFARPTVKGLQVYVPPAGRLQAATAELNRALDRIEGP